MPKISFPLNMIIKSKLTYPHKWYTANIQKSYIEFATLKIDRSSRKIIVNVLIKTDRSRGFGLLSD